MPEAVALRSCRRPFQDSAMREGSRSGSRIAAVGRSTFSTRICRSSPHAAGVRAGSQHSSPPLPRRSTPRWIAIKLKQGVAVADVYQTLQAYLGGLFLNQFNRFGRQWRVYLQAEGEDRQNVQDIRDYYVRNNHGTMVPLSALVARAASAVRNIPIVSISTAPHRSLEGPRPVTAQGRPWPRSRR